MSEDGCMEYGHGIHDLSCVLLVCQHGEGQAQQRHGRECRRRNGQDEV